jgi:hypothetical protein
VFKLVLYRWMELDSLTVSSIIILYPCASLDLKSDFDRQIQPGLVLVPLPVPSMERLEYPVYSKGTHQTCLGSWHKSSCTLRLGFGALPGKTRPAKSQTAGKSTHWYCFKDNSVPTRQYERCFVSVLLGFTFIAVCLSEYRILQFPLSTRSL